MMANQLISAVQFSDKPVYHSFQPWCRVMLCGQGCCWVRFSWTSAWQRGVLRSVSRTCGMLGRGCHVAIFEALRMTMANRSIRIPIPERILQPKNYCNYWLEYVLMGLWLLGFGESADICRTKVVWCQSASGAVAKGSGIRTVATAFADLWVRDDSAEVVEKHDRLIT